jgi:hypothetical protein
MNKKWRRRAQGYFFTVWSVWIVLVAMVVLGTVRWGWGVLVNAVVSGGWVLVTVRPLIEGLRGVRKGLLVAPKRQATIRLASSFMVLIDGPDEVRLPLDEVCGATLVFEDSIEEATGLDDALRIHLKNEQDLVVGSSTQGFHDVLTWLDRDRRVVREPVFLGL